LKDIQLLRNRGEKVILVHGGGYYVTELMQKLGIQPQFVKSPSGVVSRYTDWNTLWCYVMGMMWLNKQIVSKLQELGVNAVGLSGADGKLLLAKRKEKIVIVDERGRQRLIDGGYTGKIVDVNIDLLNTLLNKDIVPVIAPIAIDSSGTLLNVDSDQVATAIATKLRPDIVTILLDVDGLILGGQVVQQLTPEEAEKIFKESPEVTGGMKRKLYMAAQIAKEGVKVVIANGLRESPIINAMQNRGTVITSSKSNT